MRVWEEPDDEPEPVVVRTLETLPSPRSTPVLDVGCGAGRHLVWLERHGFASHGVDRSAQPLARARAWLRREGRPARIALADVRALPFARSRFGAVIAQDGLSCMAPDELRRALAEVGRVLRDEGVLVGTLPSARASSHGCDEAVARDLLAGFDLDSLALDEFWDDDGALHSRWQFLAIKRRP